MPTIEFNKGFIEITSDDGSSFTSVHVSEIKLGYIGGPGADGKVWIRDPDNPDTDFILDHVDPSTVILGGSECISASDFITRMRSYLPTDVQTAQSAVDAGNSRTATLFGAEVFTGTTTSVVDKASITVFIDVSHPGTLYLQFSSDGTNWDYLQTIMLDDQNGLGTSFTRDIPAGYYRIVYVNGPVDQTHMRLQAIINSAKPGMNATLLSETISENQYANLIRNTGNYEDDISRGLIKGRDVFFRFGYNGSSPGATKRHVWNYGSTTLGNADLVWPTQSATFTLTSSSPGDDSAGAGVRTAMVVYLDSNWETASEVVTFTAGIAQTVGSGFRFIRAYGLTCGTYGGSFAGNVTITHDTVGNPVMGYIQSGFNQTENSQLTVPAGWTYQLIDWDIHVASGTNKDANIYIFKRENADVFGAGASPIRLLDRLPNFQGEHQAEFKVRRTFPEKTDIWVVAEGSAATAVSVNLAFRGYYGTAPPFPQ